MFHALRAVIKALGFEGLGVVVRAQRRRYAAAALRILGESSKKPSPALHLRQMRSRRLCSQRRFVQAHVTLCL